MAWNSFPYDSAAFEQTTATLKKNWQKLHTGDQVAFPDKQYIDQLSTDYPHAFPDDFDGDAKQMANQLQAAWVAYHAGDFAAAVGQAEACGIIGHSVTNKATGIYATYLEDNEKTKVKLFQQIAAYAEQAQEVLPDDANAYYFHAFALGRYSQSISITKALKQGLGGKIKHSLESALELAPDHAEAHTALGLYHAEIIDKVGKLIGGMTYGASADQALEHFKRAISLTPGAPIAQIEYANGLYMLYGDKKIDQVSELYNQAVALPPLEAMQKLDIEAALAEME